MKRFVPALLALFLATSPTLAADAPAKEPIKIGELFPYAALPDDAQKWQQGWKLGLQEINENGGVLGKPLEIISRDDKASPPETIKALEELKNRENVKIVIGTLHSHTGLAASAFAKQNDMLLFRGYAGTSKLTAEAGHDRFFQIQAHSAVWAGICAEKAAQSGKKRWAIISADYELGRNIVDQFQQDLKRLNPDVVFVETQWFPLGKLEAGATAQVVAHSNPDGIFVLIFGPDYLKLVREGNKRHLFDDRLIISPVAGNAGYIVPLGKEAPVGWFSGAGYPLDKIASYRHTAFLNNFKKTYNSQPYLASLYGYSAIKILAESINAVGTDDPNKVAAYIKSHTFDIPGYKLAFRADGVSNVGDWVGFTGFENDIPTILNPEYIAPEKYLPSVEENMRKWTK